MSFKTVSAISGLINRPSGHSNVSIGLDNEIKEWLDAAVSAVGR